MSSRPRPTPSSSTYSRSNHDSGRSAPRQPYSSRPASGGVIGRSNGKPGAARPTPPPGPPPWARKAQPANGARDARDTRSWRREDPKAEQKKQDNGVADEEEVPMDAEDNENGDEQFGEEAVDNQDYNPDENGDLNDDPFDEDQVELNQDDVEDVPIEEEEEPLEEENEFDEDREDRELDEPAKEEEVIPEREDDIPLEEVKEEHRDAVEGNLELKRALSSKSDDSTTNGNPAKTRKLENGTPAPMKPGDNPTIKTLLNRWRLQQQVEVSVKYVLRVAIPDDLEELARSRWAPDARHKKRTETEQVDEQLMRIRERRGPPATAIDAVGAFKHRWLLSAEQDTRLSKLTHRKLQYVLKNHDGKRSIEETLDEAPEGDIDGEPELAAPERRGVFVMGRSHSLELIDPYGDSLVLGDANLSFSTQLMLHRKGLHHLGRLVATTFETIEQLKERYPEINDTIKDLEDNLSEVMHNVDCTRLAVDPRFKGMENKFGAVYYNFPHAGVVKGFFDSHPFVRWRHANLMHLFFCALRAFVKPGGFVKVASNSRATGVRFSDIIGGAKDSEFVHVATFPFYDWTLCRYRRSYGDKRDIVKRPEDGEVYNVQRGNMDMVYCFEYRPSGKPARAARVSYPPTKQELLNSKEGSIPMHGDARKRKVEELYQLFLSYVQGIHVG